MHRRAAVPLLLALCLLAPMAAAQDTGVRPGTVWTVFTTVEAVVRDNYATVKVIADIGNRGPDPEFPFLVRVPDDAFVTGLTIERDGVVHEATIAPREQARQTYEDWKARQETGGLVEKQRHSSVYAYLVNVAEFTSVRATLTYERYLAADRGVHNLSLEAPVSGFGEDLGARFDVLVLHEDGVTAAWGSSGAPARAEDGGWRIRHEVGPRPDDAATPFLVGYTLPATDDAGSLHTSVEDGVGYFAHRFRAPADAEQMPLDLVLVLDVSGSMSGLKMEQMRDAATQVVRLLDADDRLHLAFFSDAASSPWKGLRAMTPEARAEAARETQYALVAGGTNLEAAIRSGFAGLEGVDWSAEEGRLPAVVVLTDGQPTSGVTDRALLRELARDANTHGVNVFTIAFGEDADWAFLHGLALDGEGASLRVPSGAGAEVDLRRFLATLATPVLKDVRAEYGPGAEARRTSAPILFAGSELLVLGTFDPAKGITGTVRATAPDGAREYALPQAEDARTGLLPRVVAYHEIRRLQDLIGAEGARAEWTDEVTRLGMEHGFVTDYTSLVLTLEPRQPGAVTPQGQGTWDATTANGSGAVRTDAASSGGSGWSGVMGRLLGGQEASSSAAGAPVPTTTSPGGGAPTPSASVPGPGAALVVAALAAAVLLARGRRG